MSTLFELSTEANRLEELLLQSEGELTPEFEMWLDQINTQLEAKADSYAHVIDKLEANVKMLKESAAQYNKAAKTLEAAQGRIKDRIKEALQLMNKTTLKGNKRSFVLSNCVQRLVIDEIFLDPNYTMVKTEVLPDRERIKKDLEQGIEVCGAKLEGGKALRVTVRK